MAVDFLIPPSRPGDQGGHLRNIEDDFAAIIAPGLRLAFTDRVKRTLDGKTIHDELAKREIGVRGPAAFVVMKALAFRNRGENEDAYDLVYLLRNFEPDNATVAASLGALLKEPEAIEAVGFLREDFETVGSLGPRRVSEFLFDARNDETEADAWGAARDLLEVLPA